MTVVMDVPATIYVGDERTEFVVEDIGGWAFLEDAPVVFAIGRWKDHDPEDERRHMYFPLAQTVIEADVNALALYMEHVEEGDVIELDQPSEEKQP